MKAALGLVLGFAALGLGYAILARKSPNPVPVPGSGTQPIFKTIYNGDSVAVRPGTILEFFAGPTLPRVQNIVSSAPNVVNNSRDVIGPGTAVLKGTWQDDKEGLIHQAQATVTVSA